jgi:hypothetical protein
MTQGTRTPTVIMPPPISSPRNSLPRVLAPKADRGERAPLLEPGPGEERQQDEPEDEHFAVLGGRLGGGVGSHDGPGDHKAECVTADDERQRDDPRQPPGSWPCGFLLHLDEGRGANVHVERLP